MKLLLLRKYIREMLGVFESKDKDDSKPDNLLTEPDDIDDADKHDEISSGGIAGAITPLGTDATYSNKKLKKKKRKPVYGKVTSDKRKN
jgi:hypothetical protein